MPEYADILLPLALRKPLTYRVPETLAGRLKPGCRVAVELGKRKIYAGLVVRLHDEAPAGARVRPVLYAVDKEPVVTPLQLELWRWISEYYMCTLGEVMKNFFPSSLKMDAFREADESFSLEARFRTRTEKYLALAETWRDERALDAGLDALKRAKQQHKAVCFLVENAVPTDFGDRTLPALKRQALEDAGYSAAVLRELEKKGAVVVLERETEPEERPLPDYGDRLPVLTPEQAEALGSISAAFADKSVVLLHGVSGSGKTEIYLHLIRQALEKGRNVLYLLPEIAVTAQLIDRLKAVFGDRTLVYHSRNTDRSRFDVYQTLLKRPGPWLVTGTRSAVSLPLGDLGLVVVDEEHDPGFKQDEPAPRYQARDTAVLLGRLYGAPVLLGSATPSVESYYNALTGKYGRVELASTFSGVSLPRITVIPRQSIRREAAFSHESRYLSRYLIRRMEETLARKKQVILLQNRRGFSLYTECGECGFVPHCVHCNVSLTYHKGRNRLECHYCGYSAPVPPVCPACGSADLKMKGIGTEKVEEEIRFLFPEARVQRFDLDAVRSAGEMRRIVSDIDEGRVDVVIGTQMISKGFDFPGVALVGVVNADNLLNFPDFRADEKAYQLISQVSGRAGRRAEAGETVIQTAQPDHPVIVQLRRHDYRAMFDRQIESRRPAAYPPFSRLIEFILRHPDAATVRQGAERLAEAIRRTVGGRVSDNYIPVIDRIKGRYIATLLLKLPAGISLAQAKSRLLDEIDRLKAQPPFKHLTVIPNVDPF